ncbi:MAG: YabP/YqfC family sporulation protein [Lachnospiraceae bacterium]|nr:YabP/YqfC family sporulation protein [Lachnospiraceae bacterium]
MKKNKPILNEKIITACQLPKDVFLGASLISMVGNREIAIENFKNLIKYQPDVIVLQCKYFQLDIIGTELSIEEYTKEEMKIKGNIQNIKFVTGSSL